MEQTELSTDVEAVEERVRCDAAHLKLLAHRKILAPILQAVAVEYKGMTLDEIAECIDPPQIGTVPVDADSRVSGASNDDTSADEGKIAFDVKFLAVAPDGNGYVRFIVNIEGQDDFYPGYPLSKRGIYYEARLVSLQKGTIFTGQDYGEIIKVYTIWIITSPPKKFRGSITEYSIAEKQIVGNMTLPKEQYDLMTMIFVCIDDATRQENDVLRLLGVLFAEDLRAQEKERILEQDFAIPMQKELKEGISMATYSEGIEIRAFRRGQQKGLEEGKKEGLEEGKKEGRLSAILDNVRSMVKTLGLTPEAAMNALNIPTAKQAELLALI